MTKKLATLAAVLMLVVGFGTGSPADADNNNNLTIYSAKFICGDSNVSPDGAFVSLVPGDFRTAINIHNPNNRAVTVTKQVVVTEAAGTDVTTVSGQTEQGPFGSPDTDNLVAFGAVGWDCAQLLTTIGTGSTTLGNAFAKGFLIIKADADGSRRAAPLNVVAVYTTRGKSSPTNITQNVEEVKGRTIEDKPGATANTHHEGGGDD
jgi:hypothetical protein